MVACFQLTTPLVVAAAAIVAGMSVNSPTAADDVRQPDIFQNDNLVAWCIVPFDAKQRGPAERAEMVARLGLKKVAYDWRAKHVPTFEEEILQYKKHGLDYFAFWSWHDAMGPLIRKHDIHPQIWLAMADPEGDTQESKVAEAARQLLPMVEKTRSLGCKLGIYNHGGWTGEPEHMAAVCEYLRRHHHADHVGIVYNFHHGHDHVAGFANHWKVMQPYIQCLNINGMADPETVAGLTNKILPVGDGNHERDMLKTVMESGYAGPVGILDHRNELDAEESLRQNLSGVKKLARELDRR